MRKLIPMRKLIGAVTFLVGSALVACYDPNPQPGSFLCSSDLGSLCPNGLTCSPQGVCVRPDTLDMGRIPFDLAGDQSPAFVARSCEERVQQGAFTGLVPLTGANTADDEGHIAIDPTGAGRIVFQRGNQFFTAAFAAGNPKAIGTPQAVTLTAGPATLHGASFTADGKLWFAGTSGGSTALYTGTPVGDHEFTVAAPRSPVSATCAFSDPAFSTNDATKAMFAAFALGGCGGKSYIVQGIADRNIQAFYSALSDSGWSSPSLTNSGLGLAVASTDGSPHLYFSVRAGAAVQFVSASRINLSGIGGDGTEDRQLVVSADCRTLYLSSVRTGGMGGADLYAADILPE